MIAENMVALKEVQGFLNDCGLGQLYFQISQPSDVFDLLKSLPAEANIVNEPTFSDENFNLYLHKCKREHDRLEEGFNAIKDSNFGDFSWTETVGRFLQANRKEGKELLNSQLYSNDFNFNFNEFEHLRTTVINSEPLYRRINTLRHPLKNLNEQVFDKKDIATSKDFVEEQVQLFSQQASRIHHRYIIKTDEYRVALGAHYEKHYQDLSSRVQELEELIADGIHQFGKAFNDSGMVQSSKRIVYKVFSTKHKNIAAIHKKIASQYQSLRQICQRQNYFDYSFLSEAEARNIQKLSKALTGLSTELLQWRQQIPMNLQDEVARLSNKTVHPDLDYKKQVVALELALDSLIEKLNGSKLYKKAFSHKMLTIPKRQHFLESIIEQLETTAYNMRDYTVFHDWQKHWLQLPPKAQKLIQALVKVKPQDWIAAFESWYFHHRLVQNHQITIPQNDELLNRFVRAYRALKKEMPSKILAHWQQQKSKSLRHLKREKRESYQYLFSNKKQTTSDRKDFRFIWHVAANAISDTFPVLLVTPGMAIRLFSKKPHFFDLVLIDQAQLLGGEIAPMLSLLGKRKIAFTDTNEKHFGDQQSLVDHFKRQDAPIWILPYQHRAIAPAISLFNQEGLLPQIIPNIQIKNNIDQLTYKVIDAKGIYEEDQHINVKEAEIVIAQLIKIKTASNPSIAVACSTIEQRNYIANQLLQLKQNQSSGYQKIEALEKMGLSVFQLEELSGIHPDILILSLTFGYNNSGNRWSTRMDYFKEADGQLGHYLSATRPSQQMIFIHSLPMEILNYYLLRPEEKGLSTLAKHLYFAIASENKDEQQQQQLLEEFDVNKSKKGHDKTNAIFMQELANALRPYLGEDRIELNASIKNLTLPLIIKPIHQNQSPMVIQADGFFSDAPSGGYLWEQFLREEIRSLGLEYYPIWSFNWWKNPKQEARKLASAIIKRDAQYN